MFFRSRAEDTLEKKLRRLYGDNAYEAVRDTLQQIVTSYTVKWAVIGYVVGFVAGMVAMYVACGGLK